MLEEVNSLHDAMCTLKDDTERKSSYLIIAEKHKDSYIFVQSIKFNLRIFLISTYKPKPGKFRVDFLEGDFGKDIKWDGKKYIVLEDDPYGA